MLKKISGMKIAAILMALVFCTSFIPNFVLAVYAYTDAPTVWDNFTFVNQPGTLDLSNLPLDASGKRIACSGSSAKVTIIGSSRVYNNLSIVISGGAQVTIDNVSIDNSYSTDDDLSPINTAGTGNHLYLKGKNNTMTGASCAAGVHVGSSSGLSIDKASASDADSDAVLNTTPGNHYNFINSAAIGGNPKEDGGMVSIGSGTINAILGDKVGSQADSACIGGGEGANGGTVTISGGTVNAIANYLSEGAAIGGGIFGNGGTVNISGGTVNAITKSSDSSDGAGIGGGEKGDGGNVIITGGSVHAIGGYCAQAIGYGCNGRKSGILINGSNASVYCTKVTLKNADDTPVVSTGVESITTIPASAYGTTGMHTDESGDLYLYLPAGTVTTTVKTTAGVEYGGSVSTGSAGGSGTLVEYPKAISVVHSDTDTGSSVTSAVTVVFSQVMDTAVGTFQIITSGFNGSVSAPAWCEDKKSAVFTITGLSYNTLYDIQLTGFQTINGIMMADDTACNITTMFSSNASLAGLTLSQGTLSPAFSAGTLAYALQVENSVSSVNITPAGGNAYSSIKVNGSVVASGTASGGISLAVGETVIPVEVTAQDGTTKTTYTVTVTRAPGNTWQDMLMKLFKAIVTLIKKIIAAAIPYLSSVFPPSLF